MQNALGMMECIGYAAAMAAADAALKAADVRILGYETVIGVKQKASVVVKIEGEVAAVNAAVYAGEVAGRKLGEGVSILVIPRPHDQLASVVRNEETLGSLKKKEEEPAGKAAGKPAKKKLNG